MSFIGYLHCIHYLKTWNWDFILQETQSICPHQISIHREMCALCFWEHPTHPSQEREETIIVPADLEGETWAVLTWHYLRRYQICRNLAVPICHARPQKCSQCYHTWLAGALRGYEQAAAPQFTRYTFKLPQIYFGFTDVNEIHVWEKEPTETIRNINVNTGVY